jgi:hypothetical protein
MIDKISLLARNYLHKNGLYEDPRIRDIRSFIQTEYSIPSDEVEHIAYSQIRPFVEYKLSFLDKNIAEDMKKVFEESNQHSLKSGDNDEIIVKRIERRNGEVIHKKIGTFKMNSHIIYLDFVSEIEGERPQPSPQSEKILSLLDDYFQER